jgi:hypothetical protein
MTPKVESRKDPRTLSSAPEGQSARQLASTHIPPFLMKLLGLKSRSQIQ